MKVVTGVFETVGNTEETINALMSAGFSADDLGLIVHDDRKGMQLADDYQRRYAKGTTPPRDVVTDRQNVWDNLPDAYVELIHRAELPDQAIAWYRRHLDGGDVLLVVNAGDRMEDVARMVREHHGELYGMERTAATTTTRTTSAEATEVHLPVVEEEATVEKTRREVGEVRVTTESSTRDVDIPLVVTHEEVRVERRKLDNPMTPDEYQGTKAEGGEIRMPIIEEEVRMTKHPVVREELVITRVPVSEEKTLHDTVMHTEPHVETTGKVKKEEGDKKRPAA